MLNILYIMRTLHRLALELAEQVGVTLPTTAASNKLYEKVYTLATLLRHLLYTAYIYYIL